MQTGIKAKVGKTAKQKVKRHLAAYSNSAKSAIRAGPQGKYRLISCIRPHSNSILLLRCPAPSSRHNLILLGNTRINILWIYVVRCIILILFAIWSGAAQSGKRYLPRRPLQQLRFSHNGDSEQLTGSAFAITTNMFRFWHIAWFFFRRGTDFIGFVYRYRRYEIGW